jgi:hypothetical protein
VEFSGVVLGPLNTAILNTKGGTIIVPVGGAIGQSNIIVKTVTAQQVVLMLGEEAYSLERKERP